MSHSDASRPGRPIRYPRARLSPAKDELMILVIHRDEVEAGDIAPVLQQLEFMTETRELAERWEGRLGFVFEGWDDDPREVVEIPAVRRYFTNLTEAWPYWLHFIEKVGGTLPRVLGLLCLGHRETIAPGLVGWAFEDLEEVRKQLLLLFLRQNALYERLGLPESMNQRIAEEVAQLLESVFSGEPPSGAPG
ncbi:MAG: chlororespiratory reduction 6 domain-containing protein [Lamprobacter sp.]|uniref:chlororespiratory reduction 6 domain-containing protein n=1 Tax=Lamprobacter sp. TaxID=3100796 RepID=UPI002B25E15A|nr:chlororespiratory reduction 6 domain-containing protein [Lamprobacter sp.]MEA3640257.1 chlororespiratory reduction 6 domain-containing protein [Lamprobacter sp.]